MKRPAFLRGALPLWVLILLLLLCAAWLGAVGVVVAEVVQAVVGSSRSCP